MITAKTRLTQTRKLVSSDLDGETVLMSIETGKYYHMDPIGSRIWTLIKQPKSVLELCDVLLREFEVDRKQCELDVLAFLNKLAEDSLIQVVDAAAG